MSMRMTSLRSPAQLDTDYAAFLANPKLGDPSWECAWADLLTERHGKTRMPTLEELAHAVAYVLREYHLDDNRVDMEQYAWGLAFGQDYSIDAEDRWIAAEVLPQVSAATWLRATERADYLAASQYLPSRYKRA